MSKEFITRSHPIEYTLLLQKPRAPQIQGVQGRSRSILLRVLGNEGDGASSAFPQGNKHDEFFICFRNHQKFIREPCLKVFKCPVIILFFYTLSCFLCNCRVQSTKRKFNLTKTPGLSRHFSNHRYGVSTGISSVVGACFICSISRER